MVGRSREPTRRMPRGGRQAPDGYSPYKKSTKSKTGYYRVVLVNGKYWAKLKLDGERGSRKQKLFGKDGKGCKEPRDAAIILAEYLDSPGALPSAPPRAPAATHDKDGCLTARGMRLLKEHTKKANDLLGIAMGPEDEAFFAEEAAAAAAPQPVPARGPALIVGAALGEDTWVVEAQAVPM